MVEEMIVARVDQVEAIDCPNCEGQGLVKAQRKGKWVVYECPQCRGAGWVYDPDQARK